MIWILKLLGFGKTLLSWARGALCWIVSDWRHVLIAVLSLIWAYFYISASKWQSRAEKALATIEARDKVIGDLIDASDRARLAQIAMNEARTKEEKDHANDTDSKDRVAQVAAGQLGVTYRDRWRVRDICKGIAFNPDVTASNPVAESGDGPGDITNMVAVTDADHEICTGNSARLQSVKKWGDGLIDKGLAVPVE